MRRLPTAVFVLLSGALLFGCSVLPGCGEHEPPLQPLRLEARAVLQVAGRPVEVELALEQEEIRLGLMHRTEVPEDRGMLFVFESERDRSFFMHNVPITLDLCFLESDGTVINIEHGKPFEDEPKLLSARPARYVPELAGGWAERHGLMPGDRIEIPAEVAARALYP